MADRPKPAVLFLAPDRALSIEQNGGAGTHMRATVREFSKAFDLSVEIGGDIDLPKSDSSDARGSDGAGKASTRSGWRASDAAELLRRPILDSRRVLHGRAVEKELRERYDSNPPDAIYERSGYGYDTGRRLAAHWRVPHILESDVLMVDLMRSKTNDIFRRLVAIPMERRKIRSADVVVVQSDESIALLQSRWGRTTKHGKTINKGLGILPRDVEGFCYTGSLGTNPTVGYLGIFQDFHRLDLLVDAAPELTRSWTLDVTGDGHGKADLEAIAAQFPGKLNLQDAVPASEVDEVYERFDVAVIPGCASHMYPVKFLESAGRGIPTVVPRYEVFRSFFPDANSFELHTFTPGDSVDLAAAFRRLRDNPAVVESTRLAVRTIILDQYTWAASGQRSVAAVTVALDSTDSP